MTEMHAEPDFEVLAIDVLKAAGNVTALIDADAIATKLRASWRAGQPALRIRRIGGLPTEQAAQHLVRGRLQVEAYAGDEVAAFAIAQQADLALRAMPGTYPGAVVTAVRKDLAMTNSPDPDSDSARFVFGVVLYAHGIAA